MDTVVEAVGKPLRITVADLRVFASKSQTLDSGETVITLCLSYNKDMPIGVLVVKPDVPLVIHAEPL